MSKLYIAYGSNLNVSQMAARCPGARIVDTGIIKNYRLVYRGSKTGAYATIIPAKGASVPVALWEIDVDNEKNLDRYEGFPTFYHKKDLWVYRDCGGKTKAMAYIMRSDARPGYPSDSYVNVCLQGYRDCGLDEKKLWESIAVNNEEMSLKKFHDGKLYRSECDPFKFFLVESVSDGKVKIRKLSAQKPYVKKTFINAEGVEGVQFCGQYIKADSALI